MRSSIRLWIRLVIFWTIFVAVLFLPAGTLMWPDAWLFLGLYFAWSIPTIIWLYRNNPDLLAERLKGPIQKDQKGWDKVFVLATMPCFLAFMVIPGLDAVRFGWSAPPLVVKLMGLIALVPSFLLMFLVMRENTFLSKAVRIQEGHTVISTGPYAVVRHPLYVGVIVMLLAMPLALGSYYGLLAGGLMTILILLRAALEDRTLHDELPGYREYAEKVRYRLLPGVW